MKIKISTIIAIIILITLNTQSQNSDHVPNQVVASKTWFASNLEGGIVFEKNGYVSISRTDELKKWTHYRKDKKVKTY